MKTKTIASLICLTLLAGGVSAQQTVALEAPIGDNATIGFHLKTDKHYRNAETRTAVKQPIIDIPGIASLTFAQTWQDCELVWRWENRGKAQNLVLRMPELPGPEEYFIQYMWDAKAGRFDGYINGSPMRWPGTNVPEWEMAGEAAEIRVPESALEVSGVTAVRGFQDIEAARAEVPAALMGKRAYLLGAGDMPKPIAVDKRLGKTLVDLTLSSEKDIEGWTMEGPGIVEFKDGYMHMRSAKPNGRGGEIVHWLPDNFPASFVMEWTFKPLAEDGLTIVFYAARGENGEDIMDPGLPERDGAFHQYTRGKIRSYHISYFANSPNYPGRVTSNMRKNNNFFLVSNGGLGFPPGDYEEKRIRLVKDGAHSQLQVDGEVVIDWTDDGEQYGPVWGDGRIGLRQMRWTVARYKDLKIWELK